MVMHVRRCAVHLQQLVCRPCMYAYVHHRYTSIDTLEVHFIYPVQPLNTGIWVVHCAIIVHLF